MDPTSQQLHEGIEALQWAQAEKMAQELQQGYTEGRVASENHCTKRRVRQMVRTVRVFAPDQRCEELPFRVHVVCAQSPDPALWLEWAITQQASEGEIRAAIRAATGESPTRDLRGEGEAIVQHFQRWAEHADPGLLQEMAAAIDRIAAHPLKAGSPYAGIDLPWERKGGLNSHG